MLIVHGYNYLSMTFFSSLFTSDLASLSVAHKVFKSISRMATFEIVNLPHHEEVFDSYCGRIVLHNRF